MRIHKLSCKVAEVEGAANGQVYLSVEDVTASDLLACIDDADGDELRELALGLRGYLSGEWVQVEDEYGRPVRDNLARLTIEERYALDGIANANEALRRAFNRKGE